MRLFGPVWHAMCANGESGARHRFEPVQRDAQVPWSPKMEGLAQWCFAFEREGLTPEEGGASTGNLSFRTTAGFVITPSRAKLKSQLRPDSFLEVVRVEVLDGERFRVHYLGGGPPPERGGAVPSSDSLLHYLAYAQRTDVAAVFHGHDPLVLAWAESLGVPVSARETPTGTIADAREAVATLGAGHYYVIRRGHGFLSLGRTLDGAGELALSVHRRAAAFEARKHGGPGDA